MRGGERFFVDTNVLLYAVDPAVQEKQEAARQWLACLWNTASGSVSWQVLHEFYVNAIRKIGMPLAPARGVIEAYSAWHPVENSLGLVRQAWHWMDEAGLSYWDALIVAAAERAGCAYLLSEDFQDGRVLGKLAVLNPFRARPEDFRLRPEPR